MVNKAQAGRIFQITNTSSNPFISALLPVISGTLENVLLFPHLNRLYDEVSRKGDERPFLDKALEVLNISYDISGQDMLRIPSSGPVVVVSNHPFGVAEGLVLARALCSVRSDVKVMANHFLRHIPDIRDLIIFVDPYGRKGSVARNLRPLKETVRWLGKGGMVAVFPAGEVSHFHIQSRAITDPQWSSTVAGLIRKTGASVLPVFFDGSNSVMFQIFGFLHPRMRTMMLPRELLNKGEKTMRVKIGNLIGPQKLNAFQTDEELTNYLRLRTYALENRARGKNSGWIRFFKKVQPDRRSPLAEPRSASALEEEIIGLRKNHLLLENGEYSVICAHGGLLDHALGEIGRLRETTFREIGEGTGRTLDLDRFDEYYLHLFVWNREKRELVGAYRLGKTDEILQRLGKGGLYTSTLFHYDASLLTELGPALELGRSFVRREYQKSYLPLLLLWKGIGQFVCKNPQYRILFGPVSITSDYQSFSRQLMVTFLKVNHCIPELARSVRAKRPLRMKPPKIGSQEAFKVIRDIEDVSDLIADIENSRIGIPILLRQYLKLGGRLVAFSVDPEFNSAVDGLMLVDLTMTDTRILERYMGREGVETFLEVHRQERISADMGSCINSQGIRSKGTGKAKRVAS